MDLNQAEDSFPAGFFASSGPRNRRNQRGGEKKGRTMNRLIQCKRRILPLLIAGVLACFGHLPKAEAVVPAPDGGYPGGNTAEGQAALLNLTTGGFNTAVGLLSLRSLTEGSFNTGIGAGTLIASMGSENTATGAGALLSNTIGNYNTANGAFALFSNTQGFAQTAIGDRALFSNTTGDFNTAVGYQALNRNIDGNANTANGLSALLNNTTGNGNTSHGYRALVENTTGSGNTAVGASALTANTTGSSNIALGSTAGINVVSASNVICIGAQVSGANVSNSCYIGQIFGVTSSGGTAVFINGSGKLGTTTSSRRFKEEIKPMERASEALFALKPVTFRYKKDLDSARTPQFGLVAEDVEKVDPDLVVRDKEGKPYSVRYEQVNAMLLNEFLKEHRRNEEQQATIARQQKQIEVLVAGLQKVSAQLEVIRPALQTALNNP